MVINKMKVKDNELILMINEEKVKCKILLKIEKDNKSYIVYTDNEKNENGETILQVGVLNKDKVTSIKEDKEWLLIRDIINSFEKENKNGTKKA